MYILTTFRSVDLPVAAPQHTAGTLVTQNRTIKLIDGGVYDAGGDQAPVAYPFELTYACTAVATTAAQLRTTLDELRALRGRTGRLYRRSVDSTAVQWATARLMQIDYQTEARHSHGMYQPLQMRFLVYDQWHGTLHDEWTFDSGVYFDTGYALDMDNSVQLSSAVTTLTVTNGGDAAVEDAVLTITAALSPITALTIAVGSCELVFSGTIAAYTSLVIDCGARSVYNNGVAAWNYLGMGANHASDAWCRLESGDNTMTVTRTGGGPNSTIEIAFSDWWE